MITHALLALVTVAQNGAGAAQAALHPADSEFLLEVPDLPALLQAYSGAPTIRLLHDPAFQASIAGLARREAFDPGELVGALLRRAVPTGEHLAELEAVVGDLQSFSLSVSGLSASVSDAGATAAALEVTRARLVEIETALFDHQAAHGSPAALSELVSLPPEELNDGWGRPFSYAPETGGSGWTLLSLGADGAPGGTGTDADVGAADAPHYESSGAMAGSILGRASALVAAEFSSESAARGAVELLSRALVARGFERAAAAGDGAEGVERWSTGDEGGPALWILPSARRILIGLGRSDPAAAVARSRGQAPAGDTMEPRARAGTARLGPAAGATVFQCVGGIELSGAAALLAAMGLPLDAMGAGGAPAAEPGSVPSSWRTQLEGGRFHSEWRATADAGSSVLHARVDETLGALCPADAWIAVLASFDVSAWSAPLVAKAAAAAGLGAEEWLAREEQRTGLRIDRDLFGNPGGTSLVYLRPWKMLGLPPIMLWTSLADSASFARAIERAADLVPAEMAASIALKPKNYRDKKYVSFATPVGELFAAEIGGRMLLTTGRSYLIDEIKRAQAKDEGPGPLHPLFAQPAPPAEDVRLLASFDWATTFDGLLHMGAGAASMMGSDSLPFDVSKLPPAGLIGRHVEPTRVRTTVSGGVRATRIDSSLGPEALPLLGALVAWIASPPAEPAAPAPATAAIDVAAEDPAPAATRAAIELLREGLVLYRLENKRYPETLEQLLAPTPNFPENPLRRSSLPLDGWERAFHYRVAAGGGGYRLWSHGPDGADQDGGGDDLVAATPGG